MRIVIDNTETTQIYDDRGNDILEILSNHGIYLTNIVLRVTPSSFSLQAELWSEQYVIETPNNVMNIVQALHSIEGPLNGKV